MVSPGEIWIHSTYYKDKVTSQPQPKYFLVLAIRADGDIVYRLLTSKKNGRPEVPRCSHEDPYSGFYLGILLPTDVLNRQSWLDLREVEEDYDSRDFQELVRNGTCRKVHTIPPAELCLALNCAASAPDTTKRQRLAIMDTRQSLKCAS